MNDSQTPVLRVAARAAIINKSGQVLLARESAKDEENTKVGQYGLVGGRLNPGESFEDGLKREILEESGLKVRPIRPIHIDEWRPRIKGTPYQVIGIFMLCEAEDGKPQLSDEHDELIWINPAERSKYNVMEPDCFVVDMLANEDTSE